MLSPALVDEINARHGTDFRFAGRYAGGEWGAARLVDASGRAFVLKGTTPTPAAEIAATTAALRRVGYPAPEYVVVGDAYSVQEELPGTPLRSFDPLDSAVADALLELNELQAGRAVVEPKDWPRALVHSVLVGEESYMVLATLRAHSEDARRLLARCQETVRRYASDSTTTDDVVHWDFHPANTLVADRRVTGVIDWDGTTSGDRLFDLATLLYYTPDERRIRRYVLERVGAGVLAAFHAHVCIREAEWCIRLHPPQTAESALRYALEVAAAFPS